MFYGQMAPQLRVIIDLDGSGVLDPFTVLCDFTGEFGFLYLPTTPWEEVILGVSYRQRKSGNTH